MENVVFSVVTFVLVALLLLVLVLLAASLRNPQLKKDKLPGLVQRELLSARDRTLLKDLSTIAEKHSMDVFAQMGLGGFAVPKKGTEKEAEWVQLLRGYYVDFLLCNKESGKAVLAVMQGQGPSVQPKERVDYLEKVCGEVDVPVMFVKDYNLAGLEKAMLQKAGLALPKAKPAEQPAEA